MNPFDRAKVGNTSLEVTRLGLGTAPLGGWPAAIPEQQGVATVRRAYELGLRYFDTAPLYGHGLSEQYVGSALRPEPRKEFTLSTKVGRLLVEGVAEDSLFQGTPPVKPVFDFSYDGVKRSIADSKRRLGIDRIDIVFIHDPDDRFDEAMSGAYKALKDLRAAGEISGIGAGMNYSEPLARFVAEGEFDCMLVAGRYTLLEQGALDSLLPAAVDRSVSIIAGGVYNSGVLANPGPGANYDYAPADPSVVDRAQRLEEACRLLDVPLRAAAIQFPLAHPSVASVIVGARTPDEVDDNLRMMQFPIPAELWSTLKEKGLIREDAPTPGE